MIKEYIQENEDRFIDELFDFLRIPSISAIKSHTEDIRKSAQYVEKKLQEAGADSTELLETKGNPVVYGEKRVNDEFPTVLVYGHYDVQPPDPLDLWESPPFDPVIRDGKIFARGACDDKGQMYMHVKALEIMMALNSLPCNIKFIVEGEEEVGSPHLEEFVVQNKALLKADIVLISDTAMIAQDQPSIVVGLRGISCAEVEVIGPNRDLHSGVYGGAVANPANVLCSMIHTLKDESGRIAIPRFYDNVQTCSPVQRAIIKNTPFDPISYKEDLGIAEVGGEKGFTTLERTGIRPSLDVNGIFGGYIGEGTKTVLPSKACAKISMRLVPNQRKEEIAALFTHHLNAVAPPQVTVKVKMTYGGNPVIVPTDSIAYSAASKAFEDVWRKAPLPMYEGASIPVVSLFKEKMGLDTMLMGFGLNSNAIHSPNENYEVKNFLLGIETIIAFYHHFKTMREKQPDKGT